jgi:hypothetical protein
MADSSTPTSTEKKDPPQVQPLELIFSSSLAALASSIKDVSLRAVAALLAPPIGYVIVKVGRWVFTVWLPQKMAPKSVPLETVESRAKTYIADARRELKRWGLSASERRQKKAHIRQLEEALQKHRLQELQAVPTPPTPPTPQP